VNEHPFTVLPDRQAERRHGTSALLCSVARNATVHVAAGQTVRAVVPMSGTRRRSGDVQTACETTEARSLFSADSVQYVLGPLRCPPRAGAGIPTWHLIPPHKSPKASSGKGGCASGRTAILINNNWLSSRLTGLEVSSRHCAQRWMIIQSPLRSTAIEMGAIRIPQSDGPPSTWSNRCRECRQLGQWFRRSPSGPYVMTVSPH